MGPLHVNRPLIDAVNAMSQLPEQIFSWAGIVLIGCLALWMARYIIKSR